MVSTFNVSTASFNFPAISRLGDTFKCGRGGGSWVTSFLRSCPPFKGFWWEGLIGWLDNASGKHLVSSRELGRVWGNKVASNGTVRCEAPRSASIIGGEFQVLVTPRYQWRDLEVPGSVEARSIHEITQRSFFADRFRLLD